MQREVGQVGVDSLADGIGLGEREGRRDRIEYSLVNFRVYLLRLASLKAIVFVVCTFYMII